MEVRGMVIGGIKLLLLGVVVLFFLNGMALHDIPEPKLESMFLSKIQDSGLKDGKVILNEVHGNSCTFLFENSAGEKACATYSKSLYGRRWKEEKFFTSKMGILETNKISYDINDKLSVFEVTCSFGAKPQVLFGKDKLLVLSVKTFGVCVVLMAGFAGKIIAGRKRNRI